MWKWGECRVRSDELYHYGIIGQKWGVRRFQNPDGTLTTEGKARYKSKEEKENEYKQQCLEKAIESAKKDKAHWETIVKNSKQALKELKTDKHKGDWYDDDEEKQMVIDEEKGRLSSAQEHANDWNKILKQLNEMPVEDMPIKVVKERTERNYIINAMSNDEDLNDGYRKELDDANERSSPANKVLKSISCDLYNSNIKKDIETKLSKKELIEYSKQLESALNKYAEEDTYSVNLKDVWKETANKSPAERFYTALMIYYDYFETDFPEIEKKLGWE